MAFPPAPGVQTATVTLTSAEILAIKTTPITIVAAPGSGFMVVPFSCMFNYQHGATPYTDGGGHLNVYADAAPGNAFFQVTTAGFWDQAGSIIHVATQIASGTGLSGYDNQALMVAQDTANPTLGDGEVEVSVSYHVVAVA